MARNGGLVVDRWDNHAITTQRWQEAMPIPPDDPTVSQRTRAVAQGLIRTRRAEHQCVFDQGMLRFRGRNGGHYWISLDGRRLLRGRELFEAEELQPKFIDAMERAGTIVAMDPASSGRPLRPTQLAVAVAALSVTQELRLEPTRRDHRSCFRRPAGGPDELVRENANPPVFA